ncbi:MAG: hypothetical protein R2761_24570 [Acidimicrobiales bacterium]
MVTDKQQAPRHTRALVRATTTAITLSGVILAMGAPVKWGLRISQLASLGS